MPVKVQNYHFTTNDAAIRNILKEQLISKHSKDKTVRIIEELGVNHGSSRVDIAVVNGILHGYEIKSDLDTLKRLPLQIDAYNSVFDEITVVVGENHIQAAIDLIPDWWGISLVRKNLEGNLYISKIRSPETNLTVDSVSLAKLLWRDEALALLESINAAKGVRTKTRMTIYKRLAEEFSQTELREKVRETLFFRPNWRVDQKLHKNDG